MKKKSTRKISSQQFIASTVAAAVVVSPIGGSFTVDAAGNSFSDVSKDAYYYDAVQELAQNGVLGGYPDGTFKPNNAVTRAEFSAFLVKMLDLDTTTVTNPNFKDVHTNAWYFGSVAALANEDLIGGYEDGSFQPNKKITRAEISALLTRVCNLSADSTTALPFNDIPQNAWYKDVVSALYQSKLIAGKTSTTFAPNDNATRAEAAVFLHRAKSNGLLPTAAASAKVEAVTNESVTIDGATYQISENVKGLLNTANSSALKDAKISFVASNKTITKITALEITASGQAVSADEAEFSKNVVVDGSNAAINGKLKISGNYVSVKNVKVTGDLEIAKELQNDFFSQNITVSGKTIINGGDSNTVVFTDAALNTVEVNKADVKIEPKGTTTIKEVVVKSNANITADDSVVIPKLTVQDGVEKLNLNVKVDNVVVDTTKDLSLYGPKLGTLELVKSTKITLVTGSKVANLVLPDGVAAKDIIKNYNDVKKGIAKINGKTNPDASAGGGGGGGGNGGGGGGSSTPDINDGKPIKGSYEININDGSDTVYGPEAGQTTVAETLTVNLNVANKDKDIQLRNISAKNLTIVGDAAEIVDLRNIDISGTLKITTPNGSVKLDSASSVVKTDIVDVAFGTFSSAAKHTGTITVLDNTDAKIELTGDVSNATLEISGGGRVALEGTFDLPIVVKDTTKSLTLEVSNETKIIQPITVQSNNVTLGGEGVAKLLEKVEVAEGTTITVDTSKATDPGIDDLLKVFDAKTALTWSEISGGNDIKQVTKDLVQPLPDKKGDVLISWESSDTTIIDHTGVLKRDDIEDEKATLTATLSYNGKVLTKQFELIVDTIEPNIESITFKGIQPVTSVGDTFTIDLTQINSTNLFSATIKVNQASKLGLTMGEVGSVGDFSLAKGDNDIDTIDLTNANLSVNNLDSTILKEILDSYKNGDIDQIEMYRALNIEKMFDVIGSSDVVDELFSTNSINIDGIIQKIEGKGVATDVYNAIVIDDVIDVLIENEDDLDTFYPSLKDALNIYDKKDEYTDLNKFYSDLYGAIDFNEVLSTIAREKPEKISALINTINVDQILTSLESHLSQDDFKAILDEDVKFDYIFTTLQESQIDPSSVLGVIELSPLFKALGESEGFTRDLFEILAKADGNSTDNTFTVGAKLSNNDEEVKEYTIKMIIAPAVGGGSATPSTLE